MTARARPSFQRKLESPVPCAAGRQKAKGFLLPLERRSGRQSRALPSPAELPIAPDMDVSDLRVALFSGNYNYVRDGANQALNRLVDYLLRQGAAVRIYSPTVADAGLPAQRRAGRACPRFPFPAAPNIARRSAFRARVKRDLERFEPNIVHVASPDITGHRAVTLARKMGPAGGRLGPHPLRDLSALLRPGLPRAGGAGDPAPLLPPLRRDLRAVGFDGAAAARPADELRRRHLVARHRPGDLQSRPARPRLAAQARHRRRRCR